MEIKSDILPKTLEKKLLLESERSNEVHHSKYTAGEYVIFKIIIDLYYWLMPTHC